jgi:hypothetical protein
VAVLFLGKRGGGLARGGHRGQSGVGFSTPGTREDAQQRPDAKAAEDDAGNQAAPVVAEKGVIKPRKVTGGFAEALR